jgi:Trm5-related predicted tRNA methylase
MDSPQTTIPKLNRLPETLLRDGAVHLELEQGVIIFRASDAVQARIAALLEKQRARTLSEAEERELSDYEEVDDYLSHVNRLIRNLSQSSEENLAA